jgi:hypothetical protein
MRAEDWIDATCCSPQEGTEVLVYDDANGVIVAEYSKTYGWSCVDYGYLENVTHWMWLALPNS